MTSLQELAGLLGVPAKGLGMIAGLSDSDVAHLQASVQAAIDRNDEAIEKGVERSLAAIPRPLRGKARSMIFPGGSR